jgi:hypothetical protein
MAARRKQHCDAKNTGQDTMNIGEESATRRNFTLAGSAQALFAFKPSVALGQSPPAKPGEQTKDNHEALDRIIEQFTFTSAKDFTRVFQQLWSEKVMLTLAKVADAVEETLTEIVTKAQSVLIKDYGANEIDRESLRPVIAGTIYVQNIVFAVSTNTKSGIVLITSDINNMREYYCSRYRYYRCIRSKHWGLRSQIASL